MKTSPNAAQIAVGVVLGRAVDHLRQHHSPEI